MPPTKRDAIVRFNEKWALGSGVNGCWEWQGATNGCGYGQFWNGDKQVGAHRFAYEHFIRPIPIGLPLDHLCRNPACVNPLHLELVTVQENSRRGLNGWEIRGNRCQNGHDMSDPKNVYIKPNGRRNCRTCRNASQQAYQSRAKGAFLAHA